MQPYLQLNCSDQKYLETLGIFEEYRWAQRRTQQ